MKLYILRWNPKISSYTDDRFCDDFKELSRRFSRGVPMNWSIYEPRDLQEGDWFIFCRVGTECDGISGLGRFISPPYGGQSWRRDGRTIFYADMVFLLMQHIVSGTVCSAEELEKKFPEINWHGGHAGIPIDSKTAESLTIELVKYIAKLPEKNNRNVALRRNDGGRFTLACSMLSELCPDLLADIQATQTATDAMEETYMPAYRDPLTLDISRLNSGEDIRKCVRLLDWTGIYFLKDFNLNKMLFPKGQNLSLKEKFQKLLSLMAKKDNEHLDYWNSPHFKACIALFTESLRATINFLDHDCNGEMLASMSDFFNEIVAYFKNRELLDAIKNCAGRFPEITQNCSIQQRIQEAEEYLTSDADKI